MKTTTAKAETMRAALDRIFSGEGVRPVARELGLHWTSVYEAMAKDPRNVGREPRKAGKATAHQVLAALEILFSPVEPCNRIFKAARKAGASRNAVYQAAQKDARYTDWRAKNAPD